MPGSWGAFTIETSGNHIPATGISRTSESKHEESSGEAEGVLQPKTCQPSYKVSTKVLKDFCRKKRKGAKMDTRFVAPYIIMNNVGKGLHVLKLVENPTVVIERVTGIILSHTVPNRSSEPHKWFHQPQPGYLPQIVILIPIHHYHHQCNLVVH